MSQDAPNSPDQTADAQDALSRDADGGETVKSHGILAWFGMRKSAKPSRADVEVPKDKVRMEGADHPDTGQQSRTENSAAKGSLGLDAELGETDRTPRRSDLQPAPLNAPLHPQASHNKLAGLFARRSSFRENDTSDQPSSSSSPTEAQPIPIAPSRNLIPSSSGLSLTLPAADSVSPPFADSRSGSRISSPTLDKAAMLHGLGGSELWGPGIRPWMESSLRGHGIDHSTSSMSSPLGSLPEQGVLEIGMTPKTATSARAGRTRSWSDAAPPKPRSSGGTETEFYMGSTETSNSLLQPSPITPSRPRLTSRTSSGNSAILGKMRNVFSKNGSRQRSNSLLHAETSDIDDTASLQNDEWPDSNSMRPSFSSSSEAASPRLASNENPMLSLLGIDTGKHVFLDDLQTRSSRVASISSVIDASPRKDTPKAVSVRARTRPRASTMSSGPSKYPMQSDDRPTSPGLFPPSTTPPRRQASTINRLSKGRFGSRPSSPKTSAMLFPVPRKSGPASPGLTGALSPSHDFGSLSPSLNASPRLRGSGLSSPSGERITKHVILPDDHESPEAWLQRVEAKISRREIANALTARYGIL